MKKILTSHLLVLCSLMGFLPSLSAQDFDDYQPMQSSGVIPRDFLTLSSTKFLARSEADSISETEVEAEIRRQFFLESSFSIDQLLHSGKVMFNDEASAYVEKVVDVLLADVPELRSQLRFYVIKSPYVNAFATNDGIIFINIALLAKTANEAELAFILCHEITHYIRNHVIKGYVETELINRDNAIGRLGGESLFLSKEKYSRELELEADSMGLMRFLNTPYNFLAADEAMDMLLYSDLPFGEREVEMDFFEMYGLELPEKLVLEDIREIRERLEDYEDQYSTHPNVAKRRSVLESIVGDSVSAEGSFFEVSAEEFYRVQKLAQFELCNLWMREGNYRRAIYSAYTLLEDHPNSIYLRKIICKSMYAIAKYSNEDSGSNFFSSLLARNSEGEISRINHLFKKMKPSEKNVLALFYAMKQEEMFEEDEEFKQITDELIEELFYNHDVMMEAIMDAIKLDEDYDSKNNFRIALYDLLDDEELMERFERVEDELNDKLNERIRLWAGSLTGSDVNYGGLGIDRALFIDPFYWSIDQRKEKSTQYLVAEDKKKHFEALIRENAGLAGLDTKILSTNSLNREDYKAFNDLAVLKEFFSEYYMHNGESMATYDLPRLQEISERYDTRYFCWLGAMSVRQRKYAGDYIGFGVQAIFYPMLPMSILNLIRPKYETYLFVFVYDIEENKSEVVRFLDFDRKDSDPLINSQLYDLFLHMKSPEITFGSFLTPAENEK